MVAEESTPAEIVSACNALTIEKSDHTLRNTADVKDALGSAAAAGDALAVLTAIADGTAPMPEGTPDSIRLVVRSELQQLAGAGLNLASPGLNQFLRMVGLVGVAELGIWKVSLWQDAGNEGEMTEADLQSLLIDDAREKLKDRVTNASALLQESIEKSDPSTFDAAAAWSQAWSASE